MKNQFIYSVEHNIGTEEKPEFKTFKASLNVEKVIRTLEQKDTLIVLLDDFNERVMEVPDIDLKTNKIKGIKRVREMVQSEIILNAEDKERFFKLTNIEN